MLPLLFKHIVSYLFARVILSKQKTIVHTLNQCLFNSYSPLNANHQLDLRKQKPDGPNQDLSTRDCGSFFFILIFMKCRKMTMEKNIFFPLKVKLY